ncbi:hypothetical protein D3Z39_03720 [Anaerotruncus colihominis]|uniref:Uncharacterized protein n=1 Tax=Anaerotruncus colihominis TaxID=169435 RepID=A0A845RE94_9FIRM|nr:hypothetical protein [Anaerotruncus colihominis]
MQGKKRRNPFGSRGFKKDGRGGLYLQPAPSISHFGYPPAETITRSARRVFYKIIAGIHLGIELGRPLIGTGGRQRYQAASVMIYKS